jgi:hypothetical protein
MAYNKTHKYKKIKKNKSKRLKGGGNTSSDLVVYPPSEINKYIQDIIYINIDKRTNRNQRIIEQLKIFDSNKIHRMSAVYKEDNKPLGCTLSHLNALKIARDNKYPNVLILEDDAIWSDVNLSYPVFKMLVQKPYDVIMLGGSGKKFNPNTYRVEYSLAASSYLVNSSYYDKMISTIENELNTKHIDPKEDNYNKCIDVIYMTLQANDFWYIVYPSLMIQGKSYSNIAGGIVNYKRGFYSKKLV